MKHNLSITLSLYPSAKGGYVLGAILKRHEQGATRDVYVIEHLADDDPMVRRLIADADTIERASLDREAKKGESR